MLIGLAVGGAALALTVGAGAALRAAVAAGVVPGLLRPFAVVAEKTREWRWEEQQMESSYENKPTS